MPINATAMNTFMSLKPQASPKRTWYALFSWGTVAVLLLVGLTSALGVWQLSRAEFKKQVQAQWAAVVSAPAQALAPSGLSAAAQQLPQRVRLEGVWLSDQSVWLENRYWQGRAGFWLITPLRLLDASPSDPVVLVLRGWAPRDARDRTRVPALQDRVAEPVALEGVAVAQLSQLLALGRTQAPRALPAIWPNLDYGAYEQASGLHVARMVVYQHRDTRAHALDSGLAAVTLQLAAGPETHYGYAVQWFALSLALAAWGVYLGWRAWRDGARGHEEQGLE